MIAFGKNEGEIYITMEVLNYNLKSAIMNKRDGDVHGFDGIKSKNYKNLKYFILEIAGYLYQLHSNNYVHLDIKPSNCCFRNRKRAHRVAFGNGWKLIDLGLLKYIDPTINKNGCIKLNRYEGTIGYSAPEMSPYATK